MDLEVVCYVDRGGEVIARRPVVVTVDGPEIWAHRGQYLVRGSEGLGWHTPAGLERFVAWRRRGGT